MFLLTKIQIPSNNGHLRSEYLWVPFLLSSEVSELTHLQFIITELCGVLIYKSSYNVIVQ